MLSSLGDRSKTYLTTVSPVYGSLDSKVLKVDVPAFREKLHDRYNREFFQTDDSFVQQAVRAEFQTKLVDDFLAIDDTMSMAHSLENRVPLLDNQLVDLMLPVEYRFNYENGVGKVLLRKAMQRILPGDFFHKPKQGFSLNIVKWWSGELKEEIQSTISESAAVKKYFDIEALNSLIPNAKDSFSTVSLLWHVYAFHVWYGIFVEDGWKKITPAPQIA